MKDFPHVLDSFRLIFDQFLGDDFSWTSWGSDLQRGEERFSSLLCARVPSVPCSSAEQKACLARFRS